MLTRSVLASVAGAAVLMLTATTAAIADTPTAPPGGGGVVCPIGGCGVNAYDPGNPTTPTPPAGPTSTGGGSNGGNTSPPAPQCTTEPLNPQPGPGTPWWDGHTAAEGQVVQYVCPAGLSSAVLVPFFVANGKPAAPPPPDPAVLAQQAYQQIPLPHPTMHIGPDADQVAVNFPIWLWVDQAEIRPVTVTAGGVSVTATPALQSVTWAMGDPVNPTDGRGATVSPPYVTRPPVVCTGDSTVTGPPPGGGQMPAFGPNPPCGYTYRWMSTSARTFGLGCWTVSASATWVITWTSNTGASGTITAPPLNSVLHLRVGEWRTINVAPDAPPPPTPAPGSGFCE